MSNEINTLRTGNTFLSNVPRYPKERSFFGVSSLRLFFFWYKQPNQSTFRKTCPSATLSTIILKKPGMRHGTTLGNLAFI